MHFHLEIVSTYNGSLEYNLGQEANISIDAEKPYVITVSWEFYETLHRTNRRSK